MIQRLLVSTSITTEGIYGALSALLAGGSFAAETFKITELLISQSGIDIHHKFLPLPRTRGMGMPFLALLKTYKFSEKSEVEKESLLDFVTKHPEYLPCFAKHPQIDVQMIYSRLEELVKKIAQMDSELKEPADSKQEVSETNYQERLYGYEGGLLSQILIFEKKDGRKDLLDQISSLLASPFLRSEHIVPLWEQAGVANLSDVIGVLEATPCMQASNAFSFESQVTGSAEITTLEAKETTARSVNVESVQASALQTKPPQAPLQGSGALFADTPPLRDISVSSASIALLRASMGRADGGT